MRIFNATETAALLPYPALVAQLANTMPEYAAEQIHSPERQVIPLNNGGVLLSMPASAKDIAIHKLVNVCPTNQAINLPTIHGLVNAFDPNTGAPLFSLDGPTVTGRRTAAVTCLAIKTLLATPPSVVRLIGTGTQSKSHAEAIATMFPEATLLIASRNEEAASAFIQTMAAVGVTVAAAQQHPLNEAADVVITLTTSKTPIYDEAPSANRLVIGVGAFQPTSAEVSAKVVNASELVVDDLHGAKEEAGDIILAGSDWQQVKALASYLNQPAPTGRPIFFKSVGSAAWDLAAGRVAAAQLASVA
ncbi:delta(1)-pyrroline-2-carboxylate reductase family protein [Leeia sp. TBRC 13508]|uniref:Delta(1)-pyrroline-2-carboxylate reductase family protein n=1 Tax=Leeia speluncae TaxID=2884804 RepID=A0ABS8D4H6_9NEIS|nr:bifunctional Delta(1)-pyrroline-2-carboxylate/Delta(1)-piperideine-2-carboxylate reductase [Leeia speluncae]MCB6183079.1 delta(1)-pyrroline-2-carboxylate reductase family protein [Leeia speluncae]